MGKNTGKWAVGALAAGVAGYVAGVLTAPKSGKETREDIKVAAVKAKTEAEKKLKTAHSELSQLLKEAHDKKSQLKGKAHDDLDKAMDKAREAKEKTRDLLSALHEGGGEDPDLQAAVSQARQAVDHLKSFLKK